MFVLRRMAIAAVTAATAVSSVNDADAQAVRLRRGVRLAARALYGTAIRLSPGVPVPVVGLARPPYGLVPRVALAVPPALPDDRYLAAHPWGPPLSEAPRYIPGATRVVVAEYIGQQDVNAASASEDYLSATQLAALDDGALLNEVLRVAARLDDDVSRFPTGAQWQSYLRLPEDALPPSTEDGRVELGLASILATLDRLHSVSGDPAYSIISSLPSFTAMQAALDEVVSRASGSRGAPKGTSPIVSEIEPLISEPFVSAVEQAPGSAASGRSQLGPRSEELPAPALAAPENFHGKGR
jgi:hypothetical protein